MYNGGVQGIQAAAPPNLPPPWQMGIDPASGKPYYYNTTTMQTQWEFPRPTGAPAGIPPAANGNGMHGGGGGYAGGGGGGYGGVGAGAGAGAAGGAAHAPTSDDSMPVVEAFPLVEAEPTDGSEGAPTQEAPPAEEAPATEEAAPPAERRRRLLAMPKPGYSAHGHTQSLDGYMLVHVPDSAGAGEVFKAKTPSGHIWAFKVPETLPKNRIIKLHLPDLKAKTRGVLLKTPRHASLLHGKPLFKKGKMLDEAPPAEPAAVEVADLPEPEVEIVAPASDSTGGNDTEVQGQVEEEEEEEPVAAGGVGFGPGLIPPHATWSQPCCMCPLYDEETGEIEGWIGDAPQNPRSAAVTYIVVAQAVAEREEKLDDAMRQRILDPSWMNNRFHWDEPAEPVDVETEEEAPVETEEEAPSANATDATDANDVTEGNATDASTNTTAPAEEEAAEQAAEAVVAGMAHLASHGVTHLAQQVPVAKVLGRVAHKVSKHPSPKTARPIGIKSPLQIKAAKAAANKMSVLSHAHAKAVKAAALPPQKQTPLQAFAVPVAKAAAGVARGQIPMAIASPAKAVKAVKAVKKMEASHMAGMKAAPVVARAGPGDMAAVQAVAKPMTAAVAAEKPVQAVAQPLLPVK
mmetsp:Transcript_33753/g.54452  ORF Transcript_33753/g.54452 Transcript_33753/m.54452 type:complete len:630 (-) Transcript_33753:347-2236(-)